MKMKAALPAGELNGLSAVHSQLIKNRGKKVLVVGAVTSHEFTDVEGKGREAKVELVRIEAVPPELQTYIAELIERALEDRTGQTALDLDVEGVTDLRKEFKPKKPASDAQPDLFETPPALTASATPPEEIVDAEVVDEADENAAEREGAEEERDSESWTHGFPGDPTGPDADEADEPEGVPMDQFFRQQQEREAGGFVDAADDDEDDADRPGLD